MALEFPAPGDKEEASREETCVSAGAVASLALSVLCVAEQAPLRCP